MNPIAQTFIVSEPESGVDSVFVTAVDLYFKKKSGSFGVEVQIRETLNGVPTNRVVPYGSKTLNYDSINISDTATTATKFTFDTPVVLRTNEQYAITVSPLGGDPNYEIWVAELGENDVANPEIKIYRNNQLGALFMSSNDMNFIQMQNENLKYTLYTAQFSASSGNVVFRNANNDFFRVRDTVGTFRPGEQVFTSNGWIQLAQLNITGSNTFTIGEGVYQWSTGSSNTGSGIVFFSNTSVVRVSNLNGSFTTSGNTSLTGATSGKVATISGVFQNVITSSATNVITVPTVTYSEFANGNYIGIFSSSRSNGQILQIIANNTTNTITLSANVNFTDSAAIITAINSNADLYGYLSSQSRSYPYSTYVVSGVSSNSTMNFANSAGRYLIGRDSGASAYVISLVDLYYDSITAQFTEAKPKFTDDNWEFRGISNTKSADSSYNSVKQDVPYEFVDRQRMIMSRSNELKSSLAIGGSSGTSSLIVRANLSSSNNKTSPYIDTIRNSVTFTRNMIFPESFLNGAVMTASNMTGYFAVGDTIWQANSTVNTSATVLLSNSTFIAVTNLVSSNTKNVPGFNIGSNVTSTNATSLGVANVTSIAEFNEASISTTDHSRYISKTVVLAEKQDSEDLVCYLTAYRPQGTNILVYGQFSGAQDSEPVSSKQWSKLIENPISTGLYSSLVNRDDYVELYYTLPISQQLQNSNVSANSTSTIINFVGTATSAGINPGDYVYIRDNSYGISAATPTSGSPGTSFNTGDIVQINSPGGILNANAQFVVTANSSNAVTSLTPITKGSYANTACTVPTTSALTGSGGGLQLNVTYEQSTKFNVRKVIAVPNTSAIIVNSNNSFITGNSSVGVGAIGIIPDLQSQYGAFKYANNNNIIRYTTSTDQVFDSYKTFSVKIVLVSNTSQIVPRLNDMRAIALQI